MEKIYRFRSQYSGFACYAGSSRIKFNSGQFETRDKRVAEKLREPRYKGIVQEIASIEIPDPVVAEPSTELPNVAEDEGKNKASEALSALANKAKKK